MLHTQGKASTKSGGSAAGAAGVALSVAPVLINYMIRMAWAGLTLWRFENLRPLTWKLHEEMPSQTLLFTELIRSSISWVGAGVITYFLVSYHERSIYYVVSYSAWRIDQARPSQSHFI